MNTAFIVWNPFQVIQFENLIRSFPKATILVVDKGDNLSLFSAAWLRSFGVRVEYVRQAHVPHIDGVYDLVFFQSPFPYMEMLKKTRLVSLQYGLAKERHNYGEWRSLADMNLMYGHYSAERVRHFSPSFAVGNPKFDNWSTEKRNVQRETARYRMGLSATKPTILYMPTWGELGSFSNLKDSLAGLVRRYNVVIKMHHNNDAGYPQWKKDAARSGLKWIFDGAADQLELLNCADVVVSDFSGAIFDSTYARVPVVLFQEDVESKGGIQKFELSSIEFARRDEIGLVCSEPALFELRLEQALQQSASLLERAEPLRKELFIDGSVDGKTATERIQECVEMLLDGRVPALTDSQRYVREAVQALRRAQRSLRAAQRKALPKRWYLPW